MGYLIINADDFGINAEVNRAISECFQNNLIDRTTLMVNTPYALDAIEIAKKNGFIDKVGLHINLIEGTPLTENIKNTWICTNGSFNGKISDLSNKRRLMDSKTVSCICDEIDAQMKLFNNMGLPLKHLDSHQHSHIKPSLCLKVVKLARQNGFKSIRLVKYLPSNRSSLATVIYKKTVNIIIKIFNKKYYDKLSNLPLIDYADGLIGLKNELKINGDYILKNCNVEMWFHPGYRNGELTNLYYDYPFDIEEIDFLRKFQKEI